MANKFKDMMDPKLWFKSEKDRKIHIAKRDLTGGALEKELATIEGNPFVNVLQMDIDPVNPKKGFVELALIVFQIFIDNFFVFIN